MASPVGTWLQVPFAFHFVKDATAPRTGESFRGRVITRVGDGVVDPQLDPSGDDLGLAEFDEWCMHPVLIALDSGPGRQIGHSLEGLDISWTAIRIAGVINCIDTDEYIICTQHLGIGQRQGKHDGIAGRHVGDRNAAGFALRNIDIVGQRRTADGPQVDDGSLGGGLLGRSDDAVAQGGDDGDRGGAEREIA